MWPNPQETTYLVIFAEEILNGKLHFLCGVRRSNNTEKDIRTTISFILANDYRNTISTFFPSFWIQADPYVKLTIGKHVVKDRDNYVPKQLNPSFGRSVDILSCVHLL